MELHKKVDAAFGTRTRRLRDNTTELARNEHSGIGGIVRRMMLGVKSDVRKMPRGAPAPELVRFEHYMCLGCCRMVPFSNGGTDSRLCDRCWCDVHGYEVDDAGNGMSLRELVRTEGGFTQ